MASLLSAPTVEQHCEEVKGNHQYRDNTHSDLQGPGGVVSKDLLFCEGDSEGTKVLAATVWPVLLTLLLVALLQVGYHDDGGRSLLVHQPPEINKHSLFRT